MSFFNELKRRNVVKVGTAYLVMTWLILQIVAVLSPILQLPDWIARAILLVLVICFPLAVFLAWAFELTPAGIRPTVEVNAEESVSPKTGKKLNRIIIATLSLVLLLVVIDSYVLQEETSFSEDGQNNLAESTVGEPGSNEISVTAGVLEKSLVVLPFENQSNDEEQEYFSDGLTDELINKLSQVKELLVIGRNSSFFFKDSDEDLREIGELLGVSYVLQGSVRKSGNQLRVNVQLMEAQTGFNLWSRNFDRELAEVFTIQDEIAQQVTENLSISLGVGEFNTPGMTQNVAAYDAFLRGIKIMNDVGLQPELAITHLRDAVEIDPDFAQAWSELAYLYQLDFMNSPFEESDDLIKLRNEARLRVTSLASETPIAQGEEAWLMVEAGNWLEADSKLRDLIDQFGNTSPEVNEIYGSLLLFAGKASEALVYFQRARRLDPTNAGPSQSLAMSLLLLDREEEALARLSVACLLTGLLNSSFSTQSER